MANRSRRRRSAWGSVHEVSPGVWRIRYWGKGPDGEYRRRSCTVRGSRVDAERKRSELMVLHSEEAPCPTVGEAFSRWYLPAMERRVEGGEVAASTLRKYRAVWGRLLSGRWGDVPVDAVRPRAWGALSWGFPCVGCAGVRGMRPFGTSLGPEKGPHPEG